MQNITVTKQDDTLLVTSPFHPDFSPLARNLGGRWLAAAKTWQFDARDEQRVRELLKDLFGSDGTPVAPEDLVTVRAGAAACEAKAGGSEYWLCGRQVARVLGRDAGARLGDGVVLLSGDVDSGGSRKNPRLFASDDCVFEVRDVPRELAEALLPAHLGGAVTLVPNR